MKVNRSTFSKIKQQYEILRMKAAYIAAEKDIIQNPSLTGFTDVSPHIEVMTAEEFFKQEVDGFGNAKSLTVKDAQIRQLENKLKDLEEKGRKALQDENYEQMAILNEFYEHAKRQLQNLKKK